MKLISWNVNGLRACLTHGFAESFAQLDADIFSVQETKMQPGQAGAQTVDIPADQFHAVLLYVMRDICSSIHRCGSG